MEDKIGFSSDINNFAIPAQLAPESLRVIRKSNQNNK